MIQKSRSNSIEVEMTKSDVTTKTGPEIVEDKVNFSVTLNNFQDRKLDGFSIFLDIKKRKEPKEHKITVA